MTHDSAAGAGRDGSRLRQAVEDYIAKAERYRLHSELLFDSSTQITVDMMQARDVLRELLAVPDPLASDTGQGEQATLVEEFDQALANCVIWRGNAGNVRSRWRALKAVLVPSSAPLASSSAPQGENTKDETTKI